MFGKHKNKKSDADEFEYAPGESSLDAIVMQHVPDHLTAVPRDATLVCIPTNSPSSLSPRLKARSAPRPSRAIHTCHSQYSASLLPQFLRWQVRWHVVHSRSPHIPVGASSAPMWRRKWHSLNNGSTRIGSSSATERQRDSQSAPGRPTIVSQHLRVPAMSLSRLNVGAMQIALS